jgi:Caspase domain
VRLEFILKQMELGREDKTNIVFLDACRDNPLSRSLARNMGTRSTSVGKGLAQVDAGVGTFISYSTQPGNVALDGEGRNSPFASALSKRMSEKGRNLTSVMIDVRKDVIASTGGKQVPWDHSALTGDFYFDPMSRAEGDALQGRVKELEDEVKAKTKSSDTASKATLVSLKQRLKQLDGDTRRDQDKVFKLQRNMMKTNDNSERMDQSREMSDLQIGMIRRREDQQELRVEIEKLETELGVTAETAP